MGETHLLLPILLTSLTQKRCKVFNRILSVGHPVDHGVAIGAKRDKVANGIDYIFLSDFGKWDFVVNMDKTGTKFAIPLNKIHFAGGTLDATTLAEVIDTGPTSRRTAFVAVDQNRFRSTFRVGVSQWDFIRKEIFCAQSFYKKSPVRPICFPCSL